MKAVSIAQFYADPSLVDQMPEGGQLVVTSRGKTKFVVTRTSRPRMIRELAELRAVGDPNEPKVDFMKLLRSLKED